MSATMILDIILLLFFIYLAGCVLYLLLFSIAGRFRKTPTYPEPVVKRKFAVLIPAYKEDNIILGTAANALLQNYSKDCFEVVIIADQLKPATIIELKKLPVSIIEVSFNKSTKARSLKYALQQLPQDHFDIALILDADNIMSNNCLEKTNRVFETGFKVVQLHRTAKNLNTPTAIMDALSEEINNHIFRKGHRALGISSALIGSGMAFDYPIFRDIMMMEGIEENPGEDREIFLRLVSDGLACEYVEDAYVYDEKVQSKHILERQRTRWISAQLMYFRYFWIKKLPEIFRYNIHYFDYALQSLLLPRIILLGATFAMALITIPAFFIFKINILPGYFLWAGIFLLCVITLALAIPRNIAFSMILKVLHQLPATILSVLKSFLRSRSDQTEFVHTPKEFIEKNIITKASLKKADSEKKESITAL